MSEILLAKYNDNEINLDLVENPFTPGQSKYHIKWTFDFNGRSCWFEYELTPSTGSNNIPACRIGYYLNMDTGAPVAYMRIVTAPECSAQVNMALGVSSGHSLGVLSAELVDSGGEDLGFTMPNWYSPNHRFVGTVSDCNLKITIDADFPIFYSDLELYETYMIYKVGDAYYSTAISDDNSHIDNCVSGDMSDISDAANYVNAEHTIPRDKIYFIRNVLKKNGATVEIKNYRFKIPPNGKLWLVANEHDNSGQTYNMRLYAQGLGLPPSFLWQVAGSGTSWTLAHILTSTLSNYYYGEWTNYANGDWYKVANLNTNIPIFPSEVAGEKYANGEIGEDAAINSGDLGYDGKISTGDDLSSSEIPSPVIAGSGAGVNVWLLSKQELGWLFNDLYDDTQTVIDDIKEGIWLWGNNPIDFIVSIYYVPFDVSNFYDIQTERLYLGKYDTQRDFTQAKETKSASQRIVLVDTTIDNVYGDWRDLDFFKYELFLPYIGFVPLDPQVYVGHALKVEMAFDVMTHNIRYYLFSDGVVTDRVDGSVGYAIPITGTDMVNKANQNISGIVNTVKGGAEVVGGIASGNIGMGAAGALDTFNGIRNIMAYPKEIIRGDISASMNIFDINYVYLKITERQSIYPSEIRQVYNNPSYVCCTLSELSGYCELQDVQLKSSCTEQEYREIIQLLKEGVIF